MKTIKIDAMDAKKLREAFDTSTTTEPCASVFSKDERANAKNMFKIEGMGAFIMEGCHTCRIPFLQRVMDGSWLKQDKIPPRVMDALAKLSQTQVKEEKVKPVPDEPRDIGKNIHQDLNKDERTTLSDDQKMVISQMSVYVKKHIPTEMKAEDVFKVLKEFFSLSYNEMMKEIMPDALTIIGQVDPKLASVLKLLAAIKGVSL